jgi:prepilin-type N-terminal cleavage/methylation domain-containing protein
MRKRILHRLAFTMIELIFAIVIIAISVMSLPMMTQVTSAGIERNLVQEAIFASVAEINLATTYTKQ